MRHRSQPRVHYRARVRLHTPEHHGIVGQTQNLSVAGVFVSAPELPAVGTELFCDLPLGNRAFSVRGRVAWVRPWAHASLVSTPGMGIEFVDLSDELATALIEAVRPSDLNRHMVNVRFEGMQTPIRCAAASAGDGIRLTTSLPFLRLESEVSAFGLGDTNVPVAAGVIESVTLDPSGEDGIPRLQIFVRLPPHESGATAESASRSDSASVSAALPGAGEITPITVRGPGEAHPYRRVTPSSPVDAERPHRSSKGAFTPDPTYVSTASPPPSRWGTLNGINRPITWAATGAALVCGIVLLTLLSVRKTPAPSVGPTERRSPSAAATVVRSDEIDGLRTQTTATRGLTAPLHRRVEAHGEIEVPVQGQLAELEPPPQPASTTQSPSAIFHAPTAGAGAATVAITPGAGESTPSGSSGAGNGPRPQVIDEAGGITIVIPLRGSVKGATFYPLASPPGYAVKLPAANVALPGRIYNIAAGGVAHVWLRQETRGSQIRFHFTEQGLRPRLSLDGGELRLTVTPGTAR